MARVSLNGFKVLAVLTLVCPQQIVLSVLWNSLSEDVEGILNYNFVDCLSAL